MYFLSLAVCPATVRFVTDFGKHRQREQLCQLCVFVVADTNVNTLSQLCMTHEMVCRECYGRCSGEGKSQSWCSVSSRVEGSHHWQCRLWQVYHGMSLLSSSWFPLPNSAIYLSHLMQACAFALLAKFAEQLCTTAVLCPSFLLDPWRNPSGRSAD